MRAIIDKQNIIFVSRNTINSDLPHIIMNKVKQKVERESDSLKESLICLPILQALQ